jgi:hypothetical protein
VKCLQHVEVYYRRVVHYCRIVLAGEHEPRAAHVGCELVHLVELVLLDELFDPSRLPEVEDEELVGSGLLELVVLDVHAHDEVPPPLQLLHEVSADEPAGTAH